jgi:hypothetical protein
VANVLRTHAAKFRLAFQDDPEAQGGRSDFGSPYSSYSACNPYATDPPVIVDSAGNFYGRLTVNAYNTERTQDQTFLTWLAATCAH